MFASSAGPTTRRPKFVSNKVTPDLLARLSLDGRVALVTGAASGIGRATAETLARLGATVVITDRDAAAAETAARDLIGAGLTAAARQMDVTDEAGVTRAIGDAADHHGRLDILVASAGTGARMPAEEMPTERWQDVVDVNLTGSFRCAREAGRLMLQQEGGAIVFVASIMGLVGGGLYPNPAYQATKGALVNLTRTLALDWAPQGVRVNGVAPTFARTPLTETLLKEPGMEQAILDATPLARLVEPAEVAAAIAFLASDAASMITGVTLPVDGGWTAR